MCDEIDNTISEAAEDLGWDEETVRDIADDLDPETVADALAEDGGLAQLVRSTSCESQGPSDEALDDE
jgi:hypothetical protein